jgi:hypothetical protein
MLDALTRYISFKTENIEGLLKPALGRWPSGAVEPQLASIASTVTKSTTIDARFMTPLHLLGAST